MLLINKNRGINVVVIYFKIFSTKEQSEIRGFKIGVGIGFSVALLPKFSSTHFITRPVIIALLLLGERLGFISGDLQKVRLGA